METEREQLPSWEEDPGSLIYFFENGGTSSVIIRGLDDDESPFQDRKVCIHVHGVSVQNTDIVDRSAKAFVVFDLPDAETMYKNLGLTIQDFKQKNDPEAWPK